MEPKSSRSTSRSSNRAPSRISEYIDTSRLDLARTKMGTIMIYDQNNTHPIDDRGWITKKDASTSTGPTTRVKPYTKNDLPLLNTPRSEGTTPYYPGFRPRVRIPNEFVTRTRNEGSNNINVGPLLDRPNTFNIDFTIAL